MDIIDSLPRKSIKKGAILLRQGEVCQSGYRVLKGCLKSYVIDTAGKEHILQFAPEGWFISDMDSFFNNQPATIFIDAVEASEIAVMSRAVLGSIEVQDNAALIAQNQRLVRSLISTHKRLIALLSATAEERYLSFIDTYPSLLQRLPLKLIASYIGITPEYLSELRRKLAKK